MFKKEILAVIALGVSAIAFYIAKNTEEKADDIDKRVNRAVDGLKGMTEGVIDRRVSDGLVNEAIEKAAQNKVISITRNTTNMIRSTIESEVNNIVSRQFEDVKSDLDVKGMVEKKAHSIVANMTMYDVSPTLLDDVKREVIKEMKEQIKKKVVDAVF